MSVALLILGIWFLLGLLRLRTPIKETDRTWVERRRRR